MLIFTHAVPKERMVTIGPKLLQQFPKGSPQREIGLELLKLGVLQLEDGATQLLKLIRLRLGKDLQQDVSEHYKRFLHRSARLYQQSMQHYIAERSNLHERALQAVKSVFTPGKDEPSPCRVCGTSSHRVSRILDGIAAVAPRVQALGCHVHFAQPLSVSSWRQNSLMSMSEKMKIYASSDHISRRSTSAESSNLRQETQTRQAV